MALIPKVTDYGARPSLRGRGPDLPDTGRLAEGRAVARAAEAFASMAIEQRQRDDALQVAEAKAELLKGDMRIRRELEEEGDWENFDEAYRVRTGSLREELVPGIRTEADRRYFGADADLTIERGALAMGEIGRRHEVDHHRTVYAQALQGLSNDVLEAEPGTRNDHFRNAQDLTNAMIEKGYLEESTGYAALQDFVTATSTSALEQMEPSDRLTMINGALAQTGRDPAGVLADKKAPGTGTVADFLPRNVLEALKDTAETEDKILITREGARTAFRSAREAHPEDIRAQRKYVEDLNLPADQETMAKASLEEERGSQLRAEENDRVAISLKHSQLMTEGGAEAPYRLTDIPAEELAQLTPPQIQALILHQTRVAENGQPWADVSTVTGVRADGAQAGTPLTPSWEQWFDLSTQEQMGVELFDSAWLTAFTEADHKLLRTMQSGLAEAPSVQTPLQAFDAVIYSEQNREGNAIVPATGRTADQNVLYNRAKVRFMEALYNDENRGKNLTQPELKDLAADIILHEVFTPASGLTGIRTRRSITLTEEELAGSFAFAPAEYQNIPLPEDLAAVPGQTFGDMLNNIASQRGFQIGPAQMSHGYEAIIKAIQQGQEGPTDDELADIMRRR